MKFRDIPQLTRDGHYRVNVSWRFIESTLEDYTKNHKLEICPDFQRGHVWSEEKQIAYVEHVLKGGQGSREIRFNCAGWMGKFDGTLQLVDGLQRLTAVLRFLRNEIKVFGCFCKDFEDKLPCLVDFVFHINDLETRAEVLTWYLELNSGGVVHTQEELDRVKALLAQETL